MLWFGLKKRMANLENEVSEIKDTLNKIVELLKEQPKSEEGEDIEDSSLDLLEKQAISRPDKVLKAISALKAVRKLKRAEELSELAKKTRPWEKKRGPLDKLIDLYDGLPEPLKSRIASWIAEKTGIDINALLGEPEKIVELLRQEGIEPESLLKGKKNLPPQTPERDIFKPIKLLRGQIGT